MQIQLIAPINNVNVTDIIILIISGLRERKHICRPSTVNQRVVFI